MLIIVSDLHLADGTCGRPISSAAFGLFTDRLNELAFNASWRSDATYRPVESIDILLLGDIFDPLHSTLWLERDIGEPGFARPWSDTQALEFAAKLQEITRAILDRNAESIALLRAMTERKAIRLPPANRRGQPARIALERIEVPVRIHYMVGNHDWYYHLPGPAFDAIRREMIAAIGLSNLPGPFPHVMDESPFLDEMLAGYGVYARHGDAFDHFNFRPEAGRNTASLGDVFAVQVLNRFPVEAAARLGDELPTPIVESLRELVNVRPALATPLWISGQLRQNKVPDRTQKKIKKVWDDLAGEFLALDFVRRSDRRFKVDIVDGLELLMKLTRRASFETIDEIVVWIRQKMWSGELSFSQNALKEEAFIKRRAQFIVYGHTHHHEIVPLDMAPGTPRPTNQMYMNSGTWHTYYDLAVYKPQEQKFIPYQVLTYLSFYQADERGGRRFETWSGAYSD
ncbi:MAG: hypothetical protein FJZ96_12920 [Chloroflexi bacterium]|nr:hypothetical protein [Chloroflexota bacterium]